MKPSLGRIVIFKLPDSMLEDFITKKKRSEPERAAIIVKCNSNEENSPVNLYVLGNGDESDHSFSAIEVLQGSEEGQWHEPPRV